jgi:hypothetical protein
MEKYFHLFKLKFWRRVGISGSPCEDGYEPWDPQNDGHYWLAEELPAFQEGMRATWRGRTSRFRGPNSKFHVCSVFNYCRHNAVLSGYNA